MVIINEIKVNTAIWLIRDVAATVPRVITIISADNTKSVRTAPLIFSFQIGAYRWSVSIFFFAGSFFLWKIFSTIFQNLQNTNTIHPKSIGCPPVRGRKNLLKSLMELILIY